MGLALADAGEVDLDDPEAAELIVDQASEALAEDDIVLEPGQVEDFIDGLRAGADDGMIEVDEDAMAARVQAEVLAEIEVDPIELQQEVFREIIAEAEAEGRL